MKETTFDYIVYSLEKAQESFLGQTMTQEQFDTVCDMLIIVAQTCEPCRPRPSAPPPSKLNEKTSEEILDEIRALGVQHQKQTFDNAMKVVK